MLAEYETIAPARGSHTANDCLLRRALDLYHIKCTQARLAHLIGMLTRRPTDLLSLAKVMAKQQVYSQVDGGVATVPINKIRGSESRSKDFDRWFRPLFQRTRDRWIRIAMAHEQGKPLPPVTLIQVGDNYYVRDGHHRISVAQALGQEYVEAEITVWQIAR